jgi:hypothetical protein
VAPGARAYQAARQQQFWKQSAMAAVLVVEDDPQTARYIVARLREMATPPPTPHRPRGAGTGAFGPV